MTTSTISCPKCGGTGNIKHFRHVEGGVCFECYGTGVVEERAFDSSIDSSQAVDEIYSLIKRTPKGVAFAQFYVWHKSPRKESFGTGHWYSLVSIDGKETELGTNGIRVPLAEVRAAYSSLQAEGYTLITNEDYDEVFEKEVKPAFRRFRNDY